jgi:hypothetical protein
VVGEKNTVEVAGSGTRKVRQERDWTKGNIFRNVVFGLRLFPVLMRFRWSDVQVLLL